MAPESDLLTALRKTAKRTLAAAGPRYGPALDSNAPNLEIVPLQQVASALALDSRLAKRSRDLGHAIAAANGRRSSFVGSLFARRRVDPDRLIQDLVALSSASSRSEAKRCADALFAHTRRVRAVLDRAESRISDQLWALEREVVHTHSEDQQDREFRKERLRGQLASIQRIAEPVREVAAFVEGSEGQVLRSRNSVLLLGEWGTGKTHFMCDLASHALSNEIPAVIVLANMLRDDIEPLDAIAEMTGLATDGLGLLDQLSKRAVQSGRRALILIDAVNEADRESWRRRLPRLVGSIAESDSVGLIVSCRVPYDEAVVTSQVRSRMVQLRHPGFEDQEFDAQLEYFDYYRLPALHVPLLAPEFSRPLFLQLMCKGLSGGSAHSQQRQLDMISSGQKGMTFLLENFAKGVGAEVERKHKLPPKACWNILKGQPKKGRAGLSGLLADSRREWLTADEVLGVIGCENGITCESETVLRDMVGAGLLVEHVRYIDGVYTEVFMLPYQRFSDHLVARHLLEVCLKKASTETAIRRSFYSNRRLGEVFVTDRWGRQFAEPGVASALMVEFPERVKRLTGSAPRELLAYLPKHRRLLYPFIEAFLEGLYWRSPSSFNEETERLIERLFQVATPELNQAISDVLLGLAARREHPWNSEWLFSRLASRAMPDRDLTWSEYLRAAPADSNLHRLIAWAERSTMAEADDATVANLMRLVILSLTTTDRELRDRATRALVLLGDRHPRALFGCVVESIAFNDPYVPERALAAAYGVCMRQWASRSVVGDLTDALRVLVPNILALVLRQDALYSTWHTLTRGYAIGIIEVYRLLRPRSVSASDREMLKPAAWHAQSPFRDPNEITKEDVEDPERAIRSDFGNYTIGRLTDNRENYDLTHQEYAGVRRQIAARMKDLGYSTTQFEKIDRQIAHGRTSRMEKKVDRYGKKYAWIAYFEMYGLRSAAGQIEDYPLQTPRTSDCDLDPSFPSTVAEWVPPREDSFEASPVETAEWLEHGKVPDYEQHLEMTGVDGVPGEWVLLDAVIREAGPDDRLLHGAVASLFVPERYMEKVKAELDSGKVLNPHGSPDLGADHYTYHGEVPWSPVYGSDVRTPRGLPKRVNDRAFDYYHDNRWQIGIPIEHTCRRWIWESHHSELNQIDTVVFPAPPLADFLNLRRIGGSSDMVDADGEPATLFRVAPGYAGGSHYLYLRRDLMERYAKSRRLRFLQTIWGQRMIDPGQFERDLPPEVQAIFTSRSNEFRVCREDASGEV